MGTRFDQHHSQSSSEGIRGTTEIRQVSCNLAHVGAKTLGFFSRIVGASHDDSGALESHHNPSKGTKSSE